MQDRMKRNSGARRSHLPNRWAGTVARVRLGALAVSLGAASVIESNAARAADATAVDVSGVRHGTAADVEGNRYRTVIIGRQEWMVENLRTTRLNDGTPIPNVRDDPVWVGLTTPAYAWYANDPVAKDTYGALYNWFAVGTGRLAPKGWRIPSHEEWTDFLTRTLGGKSVVGGQVLMKGELKSRRTAPDAHPRWDVPNTDATNETEFNALPGGHRNQLGPFNLQGKIGFWWSATTSGGFAWYRGMRYDNAHVFMATGTKRNGFSVRCVRDLP